MSEQITVEAVKDARDWESEDGKIRLTFYTVDIKRADGTSEEVDHSRKQGGSEPQPGEKLDVIFEQGRYRPKMKKAPQSGFSGGGSSKTWQPESERDPERSARILRQHSQEMAIRAWFAYAQGDYGAASDTKGALKEWTDWFDEDVRQAAAQAQGNATPSSPASAVPPASAPLGSELRPADEDEHRLDDALYNAGVNDYDERRWLTKAWKGLPTDRQKKCLGGLIAGDIETPPKTLKGLQDIAGPMPDSFREDQKAIPF